MLYDYTLTSERVRFEITEKYLDIYNTCGFWAFFLTLLSDVTKLCDIEN